MKLVDDSSDLVHGIENAGRRFAMHHGDVSNPDVIGQDPTHVLGIRRSLLRHLDRDRFDSMSLGHVPDAFAIRAVDDDQQLSVAWNN